MRQRIGVALAAALVVAFAGARESSAQMVIGVPVYVVPSGTGIFASADLGRAGSNNTYALTGGLGLSRLGVEVSVGSTKLDVLGTKVAFGGMVGAQLFGGGLNPISIGVQAGYSQLSAAGTTFKSYLGGATVRVSPPLFPLKPFGVVYYQGSKDVGGKREVRVSVGADFNLILGLGVHAAYDWGDSGHLWGVGAHLKFSLPGM